MLTKISLLEYFKFELIFKRFLHCAVDGLLLHNVAVVSDYLELKWVFEVKLMILFDAQKSEIKVE